MKKALVIVLTVCLPFITFSQDTSTFDIYGFVMTDVIYNANQEHVDWQDGLRPTKLPTMEDDPSDSYTAGGTMYFGVRQTRIGFKSTTKTKFGDLKTQFEWELYGTGGDAGQTTPRLRHAYGQLGKWGVGQYWSPFMDIDVFPNSIEYWGPTGMVFFRNVQIRYMPIQGQSFLTIALERPGASADQESYSEVESIDNVSPKLMAPDLSAEYRMGRDWGYIEIAAIARYIGWEDKVTDDGNDMTNSTIGYGVNLTSNIKFAEIATARLGFVYGTGIENYMNDATTDIAVKSQPTNANEPFIGEALPMFGGTAFVDLQWNEKFSSTVGFSMIQIDNIEDQHYSTFETGTYGLVNLLYYPVKNVMVGVEVQYGARSNKNEGPGYDTAPPSYLDDATAMRFQFSARYNFGHTWTRP